MKTRKLFKEIKGVFVPPKKNYYIGKLYFGTPYMYPVGFLSTIIKVRKLTLRSDVDRIERLNKWKNPDNYTITDATYSNLPMVRRNKEWIINLFGNNYYIQIGWPISIYNGYLGWKDKFDTPRFEWAPSFQIYFFKWQFCIFWNAPDGYDDDYYEMILWYLYYSNKSIEIAKLTWPWSNYDTNESTWQSKYLINYDNN